ncbi:hypothetical protein SAMN02745244_00526 [Tessaracoccus bendigoensis DSM 12906]|uniref:Uncharacterized protein n=1 Tax=Tessaracoccus bendigoensis DSM 12906 TaxID=1123357 RepID=A0A1M6BRU0_9ACTN|nr:hypothetical protein [Tessaracoccus bendigoensis]SHI51397.1 hypothetical protein SAMN02745244_00526 [Tessaracoccus bendigoensis DSM 12906]
MATEAEVASALALALTGARLAPVGVASLVDDLAVAGFDADRLLALRAEAQIAQAPWPFPVPLDERRALGFARFDAALADARETLGLTGLRPVSSAHRPLNRDEQRLEADRPPHWG